MERIHLDKFIKDSGLWIKPCDTPLDKSLFHTASKGSKSLTLHDYLEEVEPNIKRRGLGIIVISTKEATDFEKTN